MNYVCKYHKSKCNLNNSKSFPPSEFKWEGGFDIVPEELIEATMNDTYHDEYYTLLRQSNTTILGIWDDNDYGVNDGEADNPIKVE